MAARVREPSPGRGAAPHPARPGCRAERAIELSALLSSLPDLDRSQLLLQWRNHLGGTPPAHLPTWLLSRVFAYRLQAATFGDLEPGLLRKLRRAGDAANGSDPPPFANRPPAMGDGEDLRPGATLAREWRGKLERVTVLEDGYAWNGRTYGSLSMIAKAITGTSWNGHRFFGLRSGASGFGQLKPRTGTSTPVAARARRGRAMTPERAEGAASMRDLHPRLVRRRPRTGLQLARQPARGRRGLRQEPGP